MANHIPTLVETEAHNLQEAARVLGDSMELVADFDSVYEALSQSMRYPNSAPEEEQYAVLVMIHLFVMCQRELTMGALVLFRAYWSDSTMHLRRAIDACASARRISKHHHLGRLWADGATGPDGYRKYKREFRSKKLYPKKDERDHEKLLSELYQNYDMISKRIHMSTYGVAGHVRATDTDNAVNFTLNFFDMPPDHTLITSLYMLLDSHKRILRLFGEMFKPYCGDSMAVWKVRFNSVEAKLDVHREKWKPFIPKPPRASDTP